LNEKEDNKMMLEVPCAFSDQRAWVQGNRGVHKRKKTEGKG